MSFVNADSIDLIPNRYPAIPWRAFSPQYEYGFPVKDLPRERSFTVDQFDPLEKEEASSLFHNFYGIDVSAKCAVEGYDEQGNGAVLAEYNGGITLDMNPDIATPRNRYLGQKASTQGAVNLLRSDGYCKVSISIADPTSQLTAYFTQTPPINSYEGFLGFGIKLIDVTLDGITSRYGGSSIKKRVVYANYVPSLLDLGLTTRVRNNQGNFVRVNAFDGSYQDYLNSRPYETPELVPEVFGDASSTRVVFTDPQGATIPLTKLEATQTIIHKVPRREDGEVVGVYVQKPPTAEFELINTRFYNYIG